MTTPPAGRMSETGERFLRAIAERIAPEGVVEVHMFPPIRQGPMESAVAIVAVAEGVAGASAADSEGIDTRAGEPRHAIYTARYRLTRKGPDRGAWAVDVVAEADAPLGALPAVVSGVQRRSDGAWAGVVLAPADGLSDADRLSGAEFRAVVGGSPPADLGGTPPGGAPEASGAA